MSLRTRAHDMTTIKRLLEGAEDRARHDGLAQPAAEHLVTAALALPDGTAVEAFAAVGVTPAAFAEAVRAAHAAALGAAGIAVDEAAIDAHLPDAGPATGIHRSDPSAQDLSQRAGDDARADGAGLLGTHVVRAASTSAHGTVPRVLDRLGVERAALRDAATAAIAGHRGRPAEEPAPARTGWDPLADTPVGPDDAGNVVMVGVVIATGAWRRLTQRWRRLTQRWRRLVHRDR